MNKFGWIAVWKRNFMVWRKHMWSAFVFHFGEPLIYLMAFGYGLGQFIGDVGNLSYIEFLAPGIVCSSCLMTTVMTSFYEAYIRMDIQKTWYGMLLTPLSVKDVIFGEMAWSASKATINTTAIIIVALAMGLIADYRVLFVFPVVLLLGGCTAAMAMTVTSIAKGFESFSYGYTLFFTPMIFISGVYFPLDNLPSVMQQIANFLPLSHAIALIRPLMTGGVVENILLHSSVMVAYGLVGYLITVTLMRRRLLD